MKKNFRKEYCRRARKLLAPKICIRNLIKGINTRRDSLIRYYKVFFNKKREKLRNINNRMRKLMTEQKVLYSRG